MTNEQIDIINELLDDNSEALTAFGDEFYDQGLRVGFKKGVVRILIVGSVVVGCAAITYKVRKMLKAKREAK